MSSSEPTRWDVIVAGGGPAGFFAAIRFAELNPNLRVLMIEKASQTLGEFRIEGKGQFKEAFVTCGGVSLKEVNFRTMESRIVNDLFFVGEVPDIDGLTGGFNFQSSWRTDWLVANALAHNTLAENALAEPA